MWFFFGFITLISFSIYSWLKKKDASWSGRSYKYNNQEYECKIIPKKFGTAEVLLGIQGLPNYEFSLKRESKYDKFFKSVLISREYQTGNKEVDDQIYIISEDEEFNTQLSNNNKLLEAMVKIFNYKDKWNFKFSEVKNYSGRIWIRFKAPNGFKQSEIPKMANYFIPLLNEVNQNIEEKADEKIKLWKDRFTIIAVIILAISTGLAFNGLAHLLRIYFIKIPFTIDFKPLLYDSIIYGVAIIIFLLLAAILLLKRSARTHLVMIELSMIGFFGAVSSAYSGLHDYNIEFDKSASVTHEVSVLNKHSYRSRRSIQRSYYVKVDDWTSNESTKRIRVSQTFYQNVEIGDELIIQQNSGALNYRWVKSMEKITVQNEKLEEQSNARIDPLPY